MSREEARHTYPYYFIGELGEGYWDINSIRISDSSFDKMFPKEDITISVKPNYDRRSNWMDNKKSY